MTDQCWAPKRNLPDPETIIAYTNAFPCQKSTNGGAVSCCRAGDTCVEGNICQNSNGYYIAGCTDSNYQDPNCNKRCLPDAWPDLRYIGSNSSLACCGGIFESTSPDCSVLLDSWKSPAPSDLKVIVAIPATPSAGWQPPSASTSSVSSKASSATHGASTTVAGVATTPDVSAVKSSSGSTATGLDASTKMSIGVGLGVGIPLLALLAGILWILMRRRRRQRASTPTLPLPATVANYSGGSSEKSYKQHSPPPEFYTVQEKGNDRPPRYTAYRPHRSELAARESDSRQEMHGQSSPIEMSAGDRRAGELAG